MKTRGYSTHIEIAKDLGIDQYKFKKSLIESDLNHIPWIQHITETCEVYKCREHYNIGKVKEVLLISTKLKRLIYKEYKRCHGTKFEPNFKSIRKDIEIKELSIGTLEEITSIKDIQTKVERPSDIKLAMIKSYSEIMKKLGIENKDISKYALDCLDSEMDPFDYVNGLNKEHERKKRALDVEILTNKLYELGVEFGDDLEGRKRFCMALSKQTGFNLKYANKSLENIINIIDILKAWDIVLELCMEEY